MKNTKPARTMARAKSIVYRYPHIWLMTPPIRGPTTVERLRVRLSKPTEVPLSTPLSATNFREPIYSRDHERARASCMGIVCQKFCAKKYKAKVKAVNESPEITKDVLLNLSKGLIMKN